MEAILSFVYILAGLILRLAIPIAGTLLLVFILRRLDARWQMDADQQSLVANKPECWKIKGCPPEQVAECPAGKSPLPCWQINRQPNGYLAEKCLNCEVFTEAPVPTLVAEPRRL